MNKLFALTVLLCAVGIVPSIALAQQPAAGDPTKPAFTGKAPKITVNGKEIPAHRYEWMMRRALSQGQQDSPELQKNIKESLIRSEIVSQEAAKLGLEKHPEVAIQLDMARQQLLGAVYVQDYLKKNPITDEKLKSEYNVKVKDVGDKEYKAQHILVQKEEDAKEVIAQLKKGGDFAKLAKDKSIDTGSKESGGSLDWSTPGSFVKEFSEAMAKLKKGEYTQAPVKTQFGYHVIKLEDTRPLKPPPFDEIKERIRQEQSQATVKKMIDDLRGKAKVEEKP